MHLLLKDTFPENQNNNSLKSQSEDSFVNQALVLESVNVLGGFNVQRNYEDSWNDQTVQLIKQHSVRRPTETIGS